MTFEIIRPLLVVPLNWLGDRMRRVVGAGPAWIMHLLLARRLVDKKSWGMIPLTSGMQSPIFDAIEYLVKKNDVASIPRLEALLAKYMEAQSDLYEHGMENGMRVIHSYGPQDYVPKRLQRATVKALLALHSEYPGVQEFVGRMFQPEKFLRLHEDSVRELLSYVVRVGMTLDVDAHTLETLRGLIKVSQPPKPESNERRLLASGGSGDMVS